MKTVFCWGVSILYAVLMISPAPAQTTGGSTATGTSRAFNPAISANGLFLGIYTSDPLPEKGLAFGHVHEEGEDEHESEGEHEHGEEDAHTHGAPAETGMYVQEVEIQLSAFVDAYLKADLTLAMHGTSGVELEEGVLTTVGLTSNVTLQAGKFYADFGKHNTLHTHQFPFIAPPIVNQRILGGEGLNEIGVGMSMLLPAEWYSEVTAQILNGDNELFASPDGEDLTYVGHWKNLWDLGESATLELGGSYGLGKNEHKELTHIIGGDLRIKWRPVRRARYRGLTFQSEYIQARMNDGKDVETAGGFYALLQAQTARRWWIQARYGVFGLPRLEPDREHRFSGMLAFVPSEFSAIRFQYNLNREAGENIHQLYVQLNFTMGSHPAHEY